MDLLLHRDPRLVDDPFYAFCLGMKESGVEEVLPLRVEDRVPSVEERERVAFEGGLVVGTLRIVALTLLRADRGDGELFLLWLVQRGEQADPPRSHEAVRNIEGCGET